MNINRNQKKVWYAIYTRSRAEKKVLAELQMKGIECFLPLQKKLRQWKDRKKWVETPLIPGYCFVYINNKSYYDVLQLNNVVGYVTFEGKAAQVNEKQIDDLKTLLHQHEFDVEITHDTFTPGKRVEIIRGPLVGVRGELNKIKGKNKFLLTIEQINKTFVVEVPADAVSAVPEGSTP